MSKLREAVMENSSPRDRWIAAYIGGLSLILAIASIGDDRAAKIANSAGIEAANTWAWFQAKNIRRDVLSIKIEELETQLALEGMSAAREQILDRLTRYRAKADELTSEPDTGEGITELFTRGKAAEARRDLARSQDPLFDQGQGLLQIAIVLASVAIVSSRKLLLTASGLIGLAGAVSTIHAFWLDAPAAVAFGSQITAHVASLVN